MIHQHLLSACSGQALNSDRSAWDPEQPGSEILTINTVESETSMRTAFSVRVDA
jgi:hypothetical protein